MYHPGGVKHAVRVESGPRRKELTASDMDVVRAKVDIGVRNLSFRWVQSSLGHTKRKEIILSHVNAQFPAGQVTAILVYHSFFI